MILFIFIFLYSFFVPFLITILISIIRENTNYENIDKEKFIFYESKNIKIEKERLKQNLLNLIYLNNSNLLFINLEKNYLIIEQRPKIFLSTGIILLLEFGNKNTETIELKIFYSRLDKFIYRKRKLHLKILRYLQVLKLDEEFQIY